MKVVQLFSLLKFSLKTDHVLKSVLFLISGRLLRSLGDFVDVFGAQLRKANDPAGGCQAPAALLVLAAL